MKVLREGLVGYAEACVRQRDLVDRRIRGEIGDTLVLLEHPPTVVFGRAGKRENVLVSGAELQARGIGVMESDRGGDVTCHCPGQLVGYPIVDLKGRGRDVHAYLRDLEEAVILALGDLSIAAWRSPAGTGVWTRTGKIASIGIGVRGWVTFHGFALNVCNDLGVFDLVNPCGMRGVVMTSASAALGRRVGTEEAAEPLVERLTEVFGGKPAAVS